MICDMDLGMNDTPLVTGIEVILKMERQMALVSINGNQARFMTETGKME